MTPRRTILLAAALFAVTTFDAGNEATARGGFGSYSAYCHWYKQLAMNTGDDYWWGRWRRCMRGNDWN